MNAIKMATNKSVRWTFNFSKWNPSDSDILLATSCIQPEEKERVAKFVFKNDFKSSLIGRLLMRKFVHCVSDIPYDKITFVRDCKGKPFLHHTIQEICPKLSFNVSHQGNFAVLAGETGVNMIGVDVMKLDYHGGKTLSEFFRIMSRQFSSNEWLTIKSCTSEKDQISMFCRHWSLKESYVKAIGVGITVNLQDISFKINTMNLSKGSSVCDTELYVENVKQNWIFEEMLIDDEHCVAVALNKNEVDDADRATVTFKEISFNELVESAVPLLESDLEYTRKYFLKLAKN